MRSGLLKIAPAVGLAATALFGLTGPSPALSAAAPPNDDKTIIHVLNRIGFGPRAGDVEKVRAMGVQAYIDQQLHPERISDSGMSARLGDFATLHMSSREIAEQYEVPMMQARQQRQQAAGRAAVNQPNPGKPANSENTANPGNPPNAGNPDPIQQRANRPLVELGEQKVLRAAYSDRQLEEV